MTDAYQVHSTLGWLPDYLLPGTYYDAAFPCTGPVPAPYCNPTIQALADEARSLRYTDPTHSLTLWLPVDQLLTDDAALVPLFNEVATVAVNPGVGNVMNRDGYGPLLDQMWVT